MNPLISVIMPVYNAEKHLKAALESILNQSFGDFELIVIDDCSTDSSAAILDSYQDARIVRVRNAQNMGIVGAMNRGLAMAQGKYIARMDADDIAFPDRFAAQIAYMEAYPNVGLTGTKYVHIDDDGGYVYGGVEAPPPPEPGTPGYMRWSLLWMTSIQHPTAMMRHDVLEKHDLRYDDAYFTAEDYDLWARMSHFCDVARLPDVHLHYRVNPAGISETKRERQLDTHFKITYREICRVMGDTLDETLMRFLFRVVIPQPQDPRATLQGVNVVAAVDLLARIRNTFMSQYPLAQEEREHIQREIRRVLLKILGYMRHSQDTRQRFGVRMRILRESPVTFVTVTREFIEFRLKRLLGT